MEATEEDERMNKMWSIHTVEEYAALKMNEILTPATTRMNLEDVMQSEISQRINIVIPLMQDTHESVKIIKTK